MSTALPAQGPATPLDRLAQAFADTPSKAWGELESARLPNRALLDSTRRLLATEMRQAREELWMCSPYMVPGPKAWRRAGQRAARRAHEPPGRSQGEYRSAERGGCLMSLVTNSLAATDEPVMHTGYRRYRDRSKRKMAAARVLPAYIAMFSIATRRCATTA